MTQTGFQTQVISDCRLDHSATLLYMFEKLSLFCMISKLVDDIDFFRFGLRVCDLLAQEAESGRHGTSRAGKMTCVLIRSDRVRSSHCTLRDMLAVTKRNLGQIDPGEAREDDDC